MKKISIHILCIVLAVLLSACSGNYERSSAPKESSKPATVPKATPVPSDEVTISSLQELIHHLNSQRERGILTSTFRYPYAISDSDFALICDSTGVMYVRYTGHGNQYTFTLTQYPGDRIADAHFSGDTSKLNSDERRVLEIAEDMVSTAKSMSSDPIEQELILHDMLIEKCTYYLGSTHIADENNPPRHLTCIGALLDGRANCQGFSDGFYTLATITGFKVERMNGFTNGEPHMFNTIYLDGAWYVVDATVNNNDSDGGNVENMYPHFNAGLDMCGSLSWRPEEEIKPIAKTSGPHYYYNIRNNSERHNYQKKYTSLAELCEAAVFEYTQNDRSVVTMMLSNQLVSPSEIVNALKEAGKDIPWRFNFTYWYIVRGNHSYISIRFS